MDPEVEFEVIFPPMKKMYQIDLNKEYRSDHAED
jgi:hypothetical protein